jgi:tetratricopeptide (TPR) repeat protein
MPPVLSAATAKAVELSEDRDELLEDADTEMQKDSVVGAENSLVATEKAIGEHALTVFGKDYDALWRAARACAWLADDFSDKKTRESFAHHGIGYAKAAVALEPHRVEGHYYLGINAGLSATTKTFGAVKLVPEVRDEAKAAAKYDEAFDHAGPLRVLGSVFAKAPPWPASIGDNEEGQKWLSRAVKTAPDYPENHLLYGDALADDNKMLEAAREYKQVLDAPCADGYPHRLTRWKKTALDSLNKIGGSGIATPPCS